MNIAPISVNNTENISKVNFGANKNSLLKNNKTDFIEISTKQSKRTNRLAAGLAAAFIAAAAAIGYNGTSSNIVSIPYEEVTSLSDISETYGIDKLDIIDYNFRYTDSKNLKIPSKFNCLEEQEKALNKILHKKNISQQKRSEAEIKMQELQNKKAAQAYIANVYCDDDYVYFRLHINGPDSIPDKKARFVAENFKDLFNIKDGALKDNNNLDFEWKSDKIGDSTKQYQDYTHALLKDGETYKVKKSDIKTDF